VSNIGDVMSPSWRRDGGMASSGGVGGVEHSEVGGEGCDEESHED